MPDPVLNIPAPMFEIARKLHEALEYKEMGITAEELLLICLLDGMLGRWQTLINFAGKDNRIEEIVSEVDNSEAMKLVLEFVDSLQNKLERASINDLRL